MTERTVYVRATRQEVIERAHMIPIELARGTRYGTAYRNAIGFALLQKISDNFIENARKGSPDVDMQWPPLSPVTIARRRQGKSDKAKVRGRLNELSPAKKRAVQRQIRAQADKMIEAGMDPKNAKSLATAQVFQATRRTGEHIPTRLELLGYREVEILRDTGIGLNAMSPGIFNEHSGDYQPPGPQKNPETGDTVDPIWENTVGEVVVGVKGYMARHHEGGENLPQRRLWPEPRDWPDSWWDHVGDVSTIVAGNAAEEILKGNI